MRALPSLEGQRLLVVGASSGIGRATALAAAEAGARVGLAGRRADRLEEAAARCGGRGWALPADVTDPHACEQLVGAAIARLDGLDSIVYAAGVGDLAPLVETSAEEWQRVFTTNVVGAALTFAAAEPTLREGTGRMVLLSSVSVYRPKPGLVAYAASKGALHRLVEGLRTEHPEVGFTMVTLGPTAGAEFGVGFDAAAVARFTDRWRAEGFLAPGKMEAEDVAARIVECLASPVRTEELTLLPDP